MRLLMTVDTVGGVWTYVTELTAELLQKGVAIAVVTVGRAPSEKQLGWLQGTAACWGSAFRWDVSEAPLEWMSDNECALISAEPLLLQVAREFGAELLHSNQFCFGALPVSLPKLVVAHSDVFSWATACRCHAVEACPWLDRYHALTNAGLCGADFLVAPTRWMLDALPANFPVPCTSLVIANGRTLPLPPRPSANKLQAVTAGRLWDEAKNVALLAEVRVSFPIFIAGETEYGSHILPVMPPDTTMLGPLAEEDLLALFRQSAIYVCTSRYEPFGLAPLEAALCGCAVLANDIPSLREVWGDGAIYFHDASSLSVQLTQLASNPQQLAAARHRSWRRAQRYTAAAMANRYLALYRAMLTKSQVAVHVA